MTKPTTVIPTENLDSLLAVLDLVRAGKATRHDISQITSLGRATVAQRVAQLISSGLLEESSIAPSTGGRPARKLRFQADAGLIAAVELGATSAAVALTDLSGTIIASGEEAISIASGPEVVLDRVETMLDELLAEHGTGIRVWGVGVGLPGPVEYTTGKPVSPPIMPGWDGYPVRDRLADKYSAPVWVDNDVNVMALGELRGGRGRDYKDLIFVKIGTGIGAGLVVNGALYRGSQGSAGDIGHIEVTSDPNIICRCGKTGCLEAVAGGAALGRLATAYAKDGESRFLAERLADTHTDSLDASDLGAAAAHGDSTAVAALVRAGKNVGRMLATVVNLYNPALIVIGGGVAMSGDVLLAAIRNAVYERSLPLATRDLRIERSPLGSEVGLHGAAFLAIDELFSRRRFPLWLGYGSPADRLNIMQDAA